MAEKEDSADHKIVSLATQSEDLSSELYGVSKKCGHAETKRDVTDIADELTRLSTTLWRLEEALSEHENRYTSAFQTDLVEILKELKMVFAEIEECSAELRKKDSQDTSPVVWFFKRGRVLKLRKHLEALKTTLMVMRTVLYHGKEYGLQNSPGRLAESSPHTMHEDRVILDTVFATNRHAILDLHNLDTISHKRNSSTSSTGFNPGAHGRKLSSHTGIEISPDPDVLPPADHQLQKTRRSAELSRRFSKRGVRLGVHMAILDLGAHDAPAGLRRKWLQKARNDHIKQDSDLSVITEVDSMPRLSTLSLNKV